MSHLICRSVLFVTMILTACNVLCETKDIPISNLLPLSLGDGKEGEFPPDFKLNLENKNKTHLDYKVFAGKRGPSIRVDLIQAGDALLDFNSTVRLEAETKYLFSVRVKVQNLLLAGPMMGETGLARGIIIYVQSATSSHHLWMAIVGAGDTDGWVTAMVPFDTAIKPQLKNIKFSLHCRDLSATVWFQDPVLIEAPAGFQMESHFILDDGTKLSSTLLKLK